MQKLITEDMQGLITRGYGELPCACYLLLRVSQQQLAKKYLKFLLQNQAVTPADKEKVKPSQKKELYQAESAGSTEKKIIQSVKALNVAFTVNGLRNLGLDEQMLSTFSREFLEGMSFSYEVDGIKIEERSWLLGDVKENHPDNWNWGNKTNPVDCLLLFYADNITTLNNFIDKYFTNVSNSGFELVLRQDTYTYPESTRKLSKEHFGFRDGISNPIIEGLSKAKEVPEKYVIKAGEFILGYKNEYNSYGETPYINGKLDPNNLLSHHVKNSVNKDFGRNGTYLVYRQIKQHALTFWKFINEHSKESSANPEEKAIKLGAKMVGRWPSGAPLVLSPDNDNIENATLNNFGYYEDDPNGYKCPLGAHIRRTNPRDQLHAGRDQQQSEYMVRKHQLLRRGRIYGEPFVDSMELKDALLKLHEGNIQEELDREKDLRDNTRGLHFICLVSDIKRQFEFVQNVWANTSTFGELCNEVDPLISPRPTEQQPYCHEFTSQDAPLRRKYKNVPQFTRVVGGDYFFLPSLKALEFISVN